MEQKVLLPYSTTLLLKVVFDIIQKLYLAFRFLLSSGASSCRYIDQW